jgi:hypothetical protein
MVGLGLLVVLSLPVGSVTRTSVATAEANTVKVEAESMSLSPAGNGQVRSDSSASGGHDFELWSNGTASASLSLPARGANIAVRAYGQQCKGAPHMVVTLDGKQVLAANVSWTSWATVNHALSVASGRHTLAISFTNDYLNKTCDRNLHVDYTVFTLAAATPTPNPGPATRTVAQWEQLYLSRWNIEWTNTYQAWCNSADSWNFYNASYYLDGAAQMAEATGEQQYVDRALQCVDGMIASARPSTQLGSQAFGDGYLGWTSYQNTMTGQEVPLFESYMWRHVTELLRVIHGNSTLYAANATEYQKVLAFTETNMLQKWYSRGVSSYIYRSNTNMASHWDWICLDLLTLSANSTVVSECGTIVAHIDGQLRQQFQVSATVPAAYVWDSFWGPYTGAGDLNVQDESHANAEVGYVVEAHGLRTTWTSADLTALSHTLTDVIWKTSGVYPLNVDGSGAGNGWISDGWDKLGRYDGTVQARLETYSVGVGTQLYGTGALNAAYLGLR